MPMRRTKKPSEHWEGTIDLLLRLVGVNAEDDLPLVWQTWANCHKKEARAVLQEHLRDNARHLKVAAKTVKSQMLPVVRACTYDSN
jgi:hypothetical protein